MTYKALTIDELNSIENLILEENFSLRNINDALTIIKNKFHKNNPPKYRNSPSKLLDYSGDVNKHFSKRLLKPNGMISFSQEVVESEKLCLDLRELLFIRESFNKQEKDRFNKFKDYVVRTFMSGEDRVMNYLNNEQKLQDIFNELKSTKYQELFKQLNNPEIKKLNLEFISYDSSRITGGVSSPIVRMAYSSFPDILEAKLRKVIYHPETKEVVSFINY